MDTVWGWKDDDGNPNQCWNAIFISACTNPYIPTIQFISELAKSIGIGIGFLSCIGIGIVKTIFQVLVLVLVLLRGFSKYWYWYC